MFLESDNFIIDKLVRVSKLGTKIYKSSPIC